MHSSCQRATIEYRAGQLILSELGITLSRSLLWSSLYLTSAPFALLAVIPSGSLNVVGLSAHVRSASCVVMLIERLLLETDWEKLGPRNSEVGRVFFNCCPPCIGGDNRTACRRPDCKGLMAATLEACGLVASSSDSSTFSCALLSGFGGLAGCLFLRERCLLIFGV